jgi:hypothetical protein
MASSRESCALRPETRASRNHFLAVRRSPTAHLTPPRLEAHQPSSDESGLETSRAYDRSRQSSASLSLYKPDRALPFCTSTHSPTSCISGALSEASFSFSNISSAALKSPTAERHSASIKENSAIVRGETARCLPALASSRARIHSPEATNSLTRDAALAMGASGSTVAELSRLMSAEACSAAMVMKSLRLL